MQSSRSLLTLALAAAFMLESFPAPLAAKTPDDSTASPTTIMGCVSPGVEAKCVILTTSDGKTYSLHGKSLPSLDKGLGVTAKGAAGGVDTCQQGTVFQVNSWSWNRTKCPKSAKSQ